MEATPRRERTRGQALVEFSIVLIPFLIILMGVIDLGRAIYSLNGTSQAAREIARVTSLHPWSSCCDLGTSSEASEVIGVQRSLIPGLQVNPSTDIVCVDDSDVVKPDEACRAGDWIRVRTRAQFSPVTPIASSFGSHVFESYSRIRVP